MNELNPAFSVAPSNLLAMADYKLTPSLSFSRLSLPHLLVFHFHLLFFPFPLHTLLSPRLLSHFLPWKCACFAVRLSSTLKSHLIRKKGLGWVLPVLRQLGVAYDTANNSHHWHSSSANLQELWDKLSSYALLAALCVNYSNISVSWNTDVNSVYKLHFDCCQATYIAAFTANQTHATAAVDWRDTYWCCLHIMYNSRVDYAMVVCPPARMSVSSIDSSGTDIQIGRHLTIT